MTAVSAYRDLTLAAALYANAGRTPGKVALRYGGREWRYADVARRTAQVANAGLGLGLAAGDRVLLAAPNLAEYFEIVLGLSSVGVEVVTLSPQLAPAELAAIVDDCGPRAAIVHSAQEGHTEALAAAGVATVRLGADYETLIGRAADRPPAVRVPETATFAITYTSGTTGRPKGVMLPHRSRLLTALAMASEYRCFGPNHRFLAITPLFHGAGFAYAAANLLLGGSVDLEPGVDVERLAARLGEDEITGVFVVPTILRRLSGFSARRGRRLASIICNAAACPQPLKELTVERYGPGLLHETYGSTEAGIVANLLPEDQLATSNSVGRPFLGVEVELRGEDGAPVPDGEVGELFARGSYGFNGYLGRPDATAEAVRDGWITVGDLARRDGDGFLHIVDRKKDMIVTGGVNVYPREVEDVLAGLPGVADVAVAGLPDEEWGERVHAFVVPEPGARPDERAMIEACRARLAPYKVPKAVTILAALPRNAGGKLLRRELRAAADPADRTGAAA